MAQPKQASDLMQSCSRAYRTAEQLCRSHLGSGEASSELQELIPSWCQAKSHGDIKMIPRSHSLLLHIAGITEHPES